MSYLLFQPLHLYLSLQSAQIDDIDVLCKRSAFGGKIPNDYYEGIRNIDDHTRKCYLGKSVYRCLNWGNLSYLSPS